MDDIRLQNSKSKQYFWAFQMISKWLPAYLWLTVQQIIKWVKYFSTSWCLSTVTAEKHFVTFRSLQEVSSRHLWPQWLHPWKPSMAQMKSATRLPIQTLFQGRHRTHWLSHTGTLHIVMCSLFHVVKDLQSDHTIYTDYDSHFSHRLHTNNAKILISLCFS